MRRSSLCLLGSLITVVVLTNCSNVPQRGSGTFPAGQIAEEASPSTVQTQASPLSTTSTQIDMQGFWEGYAGDIDISETAVGEIYNYNWYAIDVTSPTTAIIVWDNGFNCARTEAQIVNNEVRLTEREVETVFVINDESTATATFRHGERTWIRYLKKTRDDPEVICL